MKVLLGMDPGIRGCGCAVFHDGVLISAAYVPNVERKDSGLHGAAQMARSVVSWAMARTLGGIDEIVVEFPRLYGGRASRGNGNDLFPLAAIDGALAALLLFSRVTKYLPSEWKGNIDADIMIERIKNRLTAEERARVDLPSAKSLQHNVWDGIGIGLKFLNRLEKIRVFSNV